MCTELLGSRSLRQGDEVTETGDGSWRLFDLANDPGETRDLAASEPVRPRMLTWAWDGYARKCGVVLPADVRYRP